MACVGCGGAFPDVVGPTHEYLTASPGCWQVYGQWTAERAWSRQSSAVVAAHHVDCYAVQHPGGVEHDRRQRQSVAVHLISLCRLLEFDQPAQEAARTRTLISETLLPASNLADWPLLDPPERLGATTIADVAQAAGDELPVAFTRWANDCWDAWRAHHSTVRAWAGLLSRSG